MSFSAVDPRSNIREYLNRKTAPRAAIKETLDLLVQKLPNTMIFGGMLRDFALKNGRRFVSDIDLVSMANRSEIHAAIAQFSPESNKFGGFRFSVRKTLFDIWAFEDTWAFRQGFVEGKTVEDLLKTTFFNVDAAAYNLTSGKFYCIENWAKAIEARILDINLPQNPSIDGMMNRAIKMACWKEFGIGSELAKFLIEHISLHHLDRVGCMFMLGLKKHVEAGFKTPYHFDPQKSFLT